MVGGLLAAGLGIILFIVFLVLIIVALVIFLFIFWILMIIDAAKRKFKDETEKVVWILVVVLLGWLGAIIYYFAVKHPDKH